MNSRDGWVKPGVMVTTSVTRYLFTDPYEGYVCARVQPNQVMLVIYGYHRERIGDTYAMVLVDGVVSGWIAEQTLVPFLGYSVSL